MHLNHVLLRLLLVAESLDHGRQVTDRDLEREVESRKHDGEEDPPASQARDERECTSSNLQSFCQSQSCRIVRVAEGVGLLPVRASKETERADECEEDDDEDDVGAERAYQVDEAEDAHEEHEEGEGGCETDGRLAGAFGVGGRWGVGAVGVVEWLEGCGEREPERAEGDEDYEREGIAKDEFEETADDHEETTEEVVGAAMKTINDIFITIAE